MLDSVTKKRIDDLRNILVGKIPSPQSQVEQITTGLIYKFMYDMDLEAVEMGGVPSFFVDDYEKYSWKHLFDPKLGGADKVQLYSDAIENMYTNPSAPQLFREIFKNSFLPFKDPSTLNMFLKEINEFHYSHSEKLGDAFEYLLSFMGSQGDAGQFRTPRHIIDFIVEIVNPQKNETILDPACGTAGFLISSYKHILSQNTDKKLGDRLNASDRKQVGDNLVGYDISPDMTRISLVNMYLHQFASPQIHEYDTLSSEDRWNEYFDVVLANPPFMTPKGGIQPHSRFGVQSNRAEVLFVDYIMEHLKPNGRAGIVVPEGIVEKQNNTYKYLRKKLIEDCLIGVISLPAGVFQPYSGVKTSILILDKELNQKSDSIFFAKVENDGFSLGAQRTPTQQNDLSDIAHLILEFSKNNYVATSDNFQAIEKSEIQKKDFNLSVPSYKSISTFRSSYPKKLLVDFTTLQRGTTITKKEVTEGGIPVIAGGQKPAYFHNKSNRDSGAITISSSGAYAGFVSFHEQPIFASDCFTVISKDENLNQKFLFHLLKFKQQSIYQMQTGGGQPHVYARDFDKFEIPLPTIEVQQQIVAELEGYQKIIDGCKQVFENYKPTIDIDPSWEMVELGEMATTEYGTSEKSVSDGQYVVLRMGNLQGGEIDFSDLLYSNNHDDFKKLELHDGDILFNRTNSPELVGKASIFRGHSQPSIFAGYLVRVKVDKELLLSEYLNVVLNSSYGQALNEKNVSISGNQANINATKLRSYPIPTPPLEVQRSLVESINIERNLVNANRQLIDIYTQKIQDRISKVWGE
ncbi:N-6 DNA methylase [Paracoccaceae bacterium]|nr:N-6 DNA methylase [Paracoccaceae bacterium]